MSSVKLKMCVIWFKMENCYKMDLFVPEMLFVVCVWETGPCLRYMKPPDQKVVITTGGFNSRYVKNKQIFCKTNFKCARLQEGS